MGRRLDQVNVGHFTPARPDVIVRCTKRPKDVLHLLRFVPPREEGASEEQLRKKTTHRPHVHAWAVHIRAQE